MSIEDERIEGLKRKLYSNSGDHDEASLKRARLQRHSVLVNKSWDDEEAAEKETPVVRPERMERDRGPLFKKLLALAFGIFVLAAAFAAYIFISGTNFVSSGNIDITLLGPVSIPAGEDLSLDVDIANRNSSDLVLADLVVTYPDGTRSADDNATPMITDRIDVGTIPKGQHVRETIKSVLFGAENSKQNIKITLEYRIGGSSSIFEKEKDYSIFIGSSPITVTVDALKEVTPEQETDFGIKVKSNSSTIIKGLVFKAEYPFGFQFVSSVPSTAGDNTTWVIGDMAPGAERDIDIRGKMIGTDNQERVFRFYTGTQDPNDASSIGTIFVTNSTSIAIRKPFLGADIALDDQSAPVVIAHAGTSVKGEITYVNNLSVPLNDVVIEAQVTGPMLDKATMNGERGFYRSVDNTIVWDQTTLADLKQVDPAGTGRVQFNFAPLAPNIGNNSSFRNQSLSLNLTIHAKRLNENNVPDEIVSNLTRKIQVSSDLGADSHLVRSIGPFQNAGPMPPMPEQASTYTVLVSLSNSYNAVKGVVYKATLPQYVTWTGQTYPSNAGATYNADTREITWNVGDMQQGIGFSSSAKQFAYQVSFLPSIGQEGTSPIIVGAARISGQDQFTSQVIGAAADPLDTKIDTDPTFTYGYDKVGGK